MNKDIRLNSNLLIDKIERMKKKMSIITKKTKCEYCEKEYNKIYKYDDKKGKFKISETEIHKLEDHNIMNINLYTKISKINLPNINYCLITTNSLNIIDGLYEDGSYEKYIENNKNILTSKTSRFSEHSGFIYFKDNKVDRIIVLNDSRVDKNDPILYMPKNCIEAFDVDYIYHTHPKTPYIGSRASEGIIYEFPSISDILHYTEHHNGGRLLGSLIVTPEGVYIIHKKNINREKIRIDYDLIISDLNKIYNLCYKESIEKYKEINNFIKDDYIKIPDKYFYEKISINFEYINKINNILLKYDLYIDYYPRIRISKGKENTDNDNYWILPDIYVPIII